MIFAIKFKKYMANASVLGIIISKLSYWQKLYLIILLKIDKNSKLSFYCTILLLDLVVYI